MEIEALRLNSPCQTVAKGNALGRPARPHSLVLVQISHPVAHSTELRTLGLKPFLQDLSVCKEQFPSLSFLGSHRREKRVHVHMDTAGLFLLLARAIPGAPSATFICFSLCLACVFGPAYGIDLRHRKCCRAVATLRRRPARGGADTGSLARQSPLGQSVQTARQGGPERGPDPNKQAEGRGATRDHRRSRTFARSGGRSCKRHRRTMPPRPASTAAGEGSSTESDLYRWGLRGGPNSLTWRCFHWTLSIVERTEVGGRNCSVRWAHRNLKQLLQTPGPKLLTRVPASRPSVLGSFPIRSGRCPSHEGKSTYQLLRVWYQELWGFIPFSLVFSTSSFSAAYPFQRLIFRISCFESWRGTEKKTRW